MAVKTKGTLFEWEGVNQKGQKTRGVLRASGEASLSATLRKNGVRLTSVKQVKTAGRGKKITDKDIVLFVRQFATMIKAGIPILQSFVIAAKGHSNPRARQMLMDIRSNVEGGSSLAESFAKYPLYFDALFCNLIESGESSGSLDDVLERLATYKEKNMRLRAKIKSALTYPIVVLTVALVVVAGLLIFVVPTFADLFAGSGKELPAITQVILSISDFLKHSWWVFIAVIFGTVWVIKQLKKSSASFHYSWDSFTRARLGVFSQLFVKSSLARWSRTMATMYHAGLPIVDGLETASKAADSPVMYRVCQEMKKEVQGGSSLSAALQVRPSEFPNILLQMISVGEETGTLDNMLNKTAEFYEDEVDNTVSTMTALLEPLMIVILGVLVGFILVALYMPIFQLGDVVA